MQQRELVLECSGTRSVAVWHTDKMDTGAGAGAGAGTVLASPLCLSVYRCARGTQEVAAKTVFSDVSAAT